MTDFIYMIVDTLLKLLVFAIIASAILSWLVAFNVINIRHPVARQIVYFLEAVTRPVLWPFRRIIPPLGGVDITPLLALIVIQAARNYLLPWLFAPLRALIG
jgi:YggT family protein